MYKKDRKVFVTGATGLVGSHLVDRLVEKGYEVKVLIRKTSNVSFLPLSKIKTCIGDILDYDSIKDAIQGVDAVFHVGAKAADWGKKKDFYDVNVEGTKNVLKAVKRNNIKQMIYVSSSAVLGEEDCRDVKNEDAPYKPISKYFLSWLFESASNHYRYTKMLAEKEVIKECKENQINLTVARPVWVYGPREFNCGPYEICKVALSNVPVFPMGKKYLFHVVYVKDLAEMLVTAFEKNLNGVNIFNVGNEKVPTIGEYFNIYCKNLDVPFPISPPFWIAYPLAVILEAIGMLFNTKEALLLTRGRVQSFFCNMIYGVSKTKELLGFVAKTPLEEGVKETVNWWIENGYLEKNLES